MTINPGTVAAIAASLMAQGESLAEDGDMFMDWHPSHRKDRIKSFVALAWDIAKETEKQDQTKSKPLKIV